MRTLIFDTETTGLVNPRAPLSAQPHPVQLACMLREGRRIYSIFNVLITTEAEIHPKAAEAHGITPDTLKAFGITLEVAAHLFTAVLMQADRIVAHNVDFDLLVMLAALSRAGLPHDVLLKKPRICTMMSSMPVLKIPGSFSPYKWPKLIEAYKYFVDPAGFEGAHDALADVKACSAVLDAMEEQGVPLVGGKQ